MVYVLRSVLIVFSIFELGIFKPCSGERVGKVVHFLVNRYVRFTSYSALKSFPFVRTNPENNVCLQSYQSMVYWNNY